MPDKGQVNISVLKMNSFNLRGPLKKNLLVQEFGGNWENKDELK